MCCTGRMIKCESGDCSELIFLIYRISSVIRRSFFSFQNNPKNLDPSYKMDLDLWDCLGRVKLLLQQNFLGLN